MTIVKCMRACVRACVRARARACVRVCVRVCERETLIASPPHVCNRIQFMQSFSTFLVLVLYTPWSQRTLNTNSSLAPSTSLHVPCPRHREFWGPSPPWGPCAESHAHLHPSQLLPMTARSTKLCAERRAG